MVHIQKGFNAGQVTTACGISLPASFVNNEDRKGEQYLEVSKAGCDCPDCRYMKEDEHSDSVSM